MIHWSIEKLVLELKYTWRISRNASDAKTNLVVKASDDSFIGMGEAAPNIRYNELPEQLIAGFENCIAQLPEQINSLEQMEVILNDLSLSNALRFAMESASVHYLCKRENKTVSGMLGIPDPPFFIPTSYSIPVMEIGEMKKFYDDNQLHRFPLLKIKIDAESGSEAIGYLSRFCSCPLIVDANEAFRDVEACIYLFSRRNQKEKY